MDPMATALDNLEETQNSDNDVNNNIMMDRLHEEQELNTRANILSATEIANNINENLDDGKYTNEIIRLQNLIDAKNQTLEEFNNIINTDNTTKASILHVEYKELSILILLYCLFAHPQTNMLIDTALNSYVTNSTLVFVIKALLIALLFHLSTKFIKSM